MVEHRCFVSCDVVGHGRDLDLERQVRRVASINEIVRRFLASPSGPDAVWLSGGDGGHVALAPDGSVDAAISLIVDLREWAVRDGVPLRVSGHRGMVDRVDGADGRIQLVGDGINVAASVLSFGSRHCVVVSDSFRQEAERSCFPGLRFHDDRHFYLKHFAPSRLSLLSVGGRFDSEWGGTSTSESAYLAEAKEKRQPWNILYHAKRILQSNSTDPVAIDALQGVSRGDFGALTYSDRSSGKPESNGLLEKMNTNTFVEFFREGELVERENGEVFCQYDDEGDTMYLVLRGEVGVLAPTRQRPKESTPLRDPLDLRIGRGEIVGELAVALRRRRTATLQAIGSTSLLGFSKARLGNLVSTSLIGEVVEHDFSSYFEDRILEFVCNHARYFVGTEREGPLAAIPTPWSYMRRLSATRFFDSSELVSVEAPFFGVRGVYVLAGGILRRLGAPRDRGSRLDGRELPIVFADLPGELVCVGRRYVVESNSAAIVRIDERALRSWGALAFAGVVRSLRRSLDVQFCFDVFLSYNHRDVEIATAWKTRLDDAGLGVYMNEPAPGHRFKPEIEEAIRDSLVFMPLISENSSRRRSRRSQSWVEAELEYRKLLFDREPNVLPVRLRGGELRDLADGITPIDVVACSEDVAMRRAIEVIESLRSDDRGVPVATRRVDLRL